MAVKILPDINIHLFDPVLAVYTGGVEVNVVDANGDSMIGTLPDEPVATSTIADRSYTEGGSAVTIDLATKFTGATSYSVAPTTTGVSNSGAILTIDPTTPLVTTDLTVTASNLGGDAALSFSLTVTASSSTHTVTINAASRDKIIYDTNAAWGLNSADIPLSGTSDAPLGSVIYAEILSETGTVVGSEMPIATAAADGSWSGTYSGMVARADWLAPRAWVNGSTAPKVTRATVFGTGHGIAIWGQSEIYKLLEVLYDGPQPFEVVPADEMVSFHWHDRSPIGSGAAGVSHHLVTAADGFNSRFSAMAKSLIEAQPGAKFFVVLQAQSGTGFNELLLDSVTSRRFSDDQALHDAVGAKPGIITFSWYASPRGYALRYGAAAHEMIYGKTIDGVSLGPTPAATTGNGLNIGDADYFLTDLYDYTPNTGTRVCVLEPHRMMVSGNIADCRDGVRTLYATSTEPSLVAGPSVGNYQNGRGTVGAYTDGTHPGVGADGSVAFGVGLVQASIRAMDLTSWNVPVIDSANWTPDGSRVEFGSSAGPIYVRLGTTAVGFEVDGVPVDAQVVGGLLRIDSANVGDGSPFTTSTQIRFADNTTGLDYSLVDAEAIEIDGFKKFPLVDVGVPGIPTGWAVQQEPDAAVIASTIVGAPKWTITGQGDGLSLLAANFPSNSALLMTFEIDMVVRPGSANPGTIIRGNNGKFLIETLSPNGIRYSLPNNGGPLVITGAGAWEADVRQKFKLVVDQVSGYSAFYIDDVEILAVTNAPWVNNGYDTHILNRAPWTGGLVGDLYGVKAWIGVAPTDGVTPVTTPTYEFAGDRDTILAQVQAYGATNAAMYENSLVAS